MYEEIEVIKNFIIDNHLIQLIIPIGMFFVAFHLIIKITYAFTRQLKSSDILTDNNNEIEICNEIPDIINDDIILSNNQFIKF